MVDVVIGSQYGDEGKGLMVDYLAQKHSLVVRFNGGAQAGHTVVTPDGRRHEFHHFGAGTFKGASTLLSRFFLVNPVLFSQECSELSALGISRMERHVMVDRRALVSTPIDMMFNTAHEDRLAKRRHGSVGVGINETVERSLRPEYALLADDLVNAKRRLAIVERIIHEWIPKRESQLAVELDKDLVMRVMSAWWTDVGFFVANTTIVNDLSEMAQRMHLVFEGAQGLRLDEFAPDFPHVTRSRTGMTNVTLLLNALQTQDVANVHYVTRCYTTRHGYGPLANPTKGHPYGWVGPETNQDNKYQGRFRYAAMDFLGTKEAIKVDLEEAVQSALFQIKASLAVTCLDQQPNEPPKLAKDFEYFLGVPLGHYSAGPTREAVTDWKKAGAYAQMA